MAVATFNEAATTMDGIAFGIMCLNMMWKNPPPDDLEYKMNSRSFNVNVSARTIRATSIQESNPIMIIMFEFPVLSMHLKSLVGKMTEST